MKTIGYTTFLLLFTLCSQAIFAHALWIETSHSGTKGTPHDVKIYYGEYASQEIDSVGKWYSDVKEFTIWLTTPSQKKIQLQKSLSADHATASFIPDEEGVYALTVVHPAKDLGGTTKYEFSSTALVAVGNAVLKPLDLPLYVQAAPRAYAIGESVDAVVFQQGQPLANAEVVVMSGEGWTKVFQTNADGKISFPAIWKGNYVVEASHMEREEGVWHEQPFKRTWQGATTFVQVR
ncbi:DUF4198 domain-containing protein [Sphingobacterium sp. SGG-5]|uniref:DUF4198 domain-containing protein n=1 Tax=Sphingobacterium sp. SGG-5 TaxID=2710881 RepID=UPI0013ED7703|nr:DUF4198 domain-containing protein [Sphingobacterium sp. SGG-5]NGM60854.1 DUF4198 domain-containing protein [Sphingobacterium sp. SGG-5]